MYLRLSHSLNLHDHAFPGAPTMKLMPFEVIGKDGAVRCFWVLLLFLIAFFEKAACPEYHFKEKIVNM